MLIDIFSHALELINDELKSSAQAVVFCDHGFRKSGIGMKLPVKLETIYNNSIFFIDSKLHPGIQLADFAAFVINRQQILMGKEKLNEKDVTFMYSIQPMIPLFKNITKVNAKAELNPKYHLPFILKQEIESQG